ncbi:hypothetical protein [Herbaspirillum chlorophenolicum]|uniref:hypothetical protein n=1 Tax=Herbaspirillum chlorophenolicum TaxID=211589 RepID=UPI00067AB8FD|nr:hypothetical protein [Herbaspirillum chlorophenolicum]
MPNSLSAAREWLDLVKKQQIPEREIVSEQINAGSVTALCVCGCHGFDFHVPRNEPVRPLESKSTPFCELGFESNFEGEIAILLFADSDGYLSRFDVTYGPANIEAMPDGIEATKLKHVLFSKN